MVKRTLKRIINALGEPPTIDFHKLCAADSTAKFYETASINLNGFPQGRIQVGANSHIRGELTLFGHGGHIQIGEWCYVGEQTRLWSGCELTVGDRVLIAHQVSIMDNLTHPISSVRRAQHFKDIVTTGHPRTIDLEDKPVRIEDDVWIGCNSVILHGVTIGARSIVGAGSVVTSDIPPGVIVGGNPARVIKEVPPEK